MRKLFHFYQNILKLRSVKCLNYLAAPEFDYNYLCDPKNTNSIRENILRRKGIGDIAKVVRSARV